MRAVRPAVPLAVAGGVLAGVPAHAGAAELFWTPPTPFAAQPVGTFSAAQTITAFSVAELPKTVRAVRVTGADRDDFLISHDDCTARTLTPAAVCTVVVRFAPAAPVTSAERTAELVVVTTDDIANTPATLTGTAVEPPAGPVGPTGPAGDDGQDGTDGLPGPAGPQGLPGSIGPVGPTGPVGDPGPTGPVGSGGADGVRGADGKNGALGPKGATGDPGVPGLPGPAGPVGLRGSRGQAGQAAVYRCVPGTSRRRASCIVELTRGTGTRTVTVTVTRNGRTVASGRKTLRPTVRQRVEVFPKAAAPTGRYRIRIVIRQAGKPTTTLTSSFNGRDLG